MKSPRSGLPSLRSLLLPVALATLAACATQAPGPAAPVAGPVVNKLRVYVLDCGHIDVLDESIFSPGVHQGRHKTLVGSCYLVAHPKGVLLWDTGLSDAIATKPEGEKVGNAFVLKVKKTLAAQLKEIGYAPEQVKYLGISHMHFDHVGNASYFPKATVLMQKEERDAAFGPDAAKFGFDPSTYPTLPGNPMTTLQGDYDLFGDGSVVIKRALGHTPGHQALFLRLPKTGNVLLSGDLVHFTDNWVHKRVPSFNFDKAVSVQTMQETETFLKENKAVLWIQHDAEQNATLRHAPAYYE